MPSAQPQQLQSQVSEMIHQLTTTSTESRDTAEPDEQKCRLLLTQAHAKGHFGAKAMI